MSAYLLHMHVSNLCNKRNYKKKNEKRTLPFKKNAVFKHIHYNF